MPDSGLRRHDSTAHARRPVDVLLSELSTVGRHSLRAGMLQRRPNSKPRFLGRREGLEQKRKGRGVREEKNADADRQKQQHPDENSTPSSGQAA